MSVDKLKYVLGDFKKRLSNRKIDLNLIESINDALPIHMIPDEIGEYFESDLYFGSFLIEDKKIYFGFVEKGIPIGLGIEVFFDINSFDIDLLD